MITVTKLYAYLRIVAMVNYKYTILNIVGPVHGTDSHVRLLQGCTSFRDRLG